MARKNIHQKAIKRKLKFDKNKKFIKYTTGQKVLVKIHNLSSGPNKDIKNFFLLFQGPFHIVKIISENTVVIIDDLGNETLQNVKNIKPYQS